MNQPATIRTASYRLSIVTLFLLLTWVFPLAAATTVAATSFPTFPEIEPNVRFWEKIYGTYSTRQAVVHDSQYLARIYEVIELLPDDLPGAAKLNEKARQLVVKKYQRILGNLAQKGARTSEERRVASLFGPQAGKKTFTRAADNVRVQTGLKERFRDGVVRSGLWMAEMHQVLRRHGLPLELAYIPHVESSFNTAAYSKFGAAGIWQFTRSTGTSYLTINHELDERLDPILATDAAARYLKKSYSHLSDWPLAVTSYNYGLPGMIRAKKALGTYPKIFKQYNQGHFKFASRNFYPEFLAAMRVAKDLEQKLQSQINPRQQVVYHELPGYLHVSHLQSHLRLPLEQIKELNPALLSQVLQGEKLIPAGYRLRLPAKSASKQQLVALPAKYYQGRQKPDYYHQVGKGDTVSSIAARYGVSSRSIIELNDLGPSARIYLRQKLRIPQTSQGVQIKATDNKKQLAVATPTPGSKTISAQKKVKVAQREELPLLDANAYSAANLRWNKGAAEGIITVQAEETLELYATWLGKDTAELQKYNRLKSANLEPGQKLKIQFTSVSPELFEQRRLSYLADTQADFLKAFAITGKKTYRVSPGDTLWDICYNKFDIPLWLLNRYNTNLMYQQLLSSQELVIPIVEPI